MDGSLPILPVRSGTVSDLLTLEQVKDHLRVDSDDEDELIRAIRDAATERVDGYAGILGRALMLQTWTAYWSDFYCERLRLPLRPVISITNVKYYDTSNVQQTVSSSLYRLLTDQLSPYVGLVVNQVWPAGAANREDAVSCTFIAGYADADSVPSPIKAAILLMCGDLYEMRETAIIGATAFQIPMSTTVEALLAPYRAGSF